jgi:hypothetical protein
MTRAVALTFVVALAACGTASWLRKEPTGGVLRYQGDADRAWERAQQLMAEHCGLGKYKVVSEGLEPIAAEAATAADASEYRVHYVCETGG